MSIAHSLSFNKAVCEALGLDPMVTGRIVIVLDAREAVKVTVEQCVPVERMETVAKLVTLAKWEPEATDRVVTTDFSTGERREVTG